MIYLGAAVGAVVLLAGWIAGTIAYARYAAIRDGKRDVPILGGVLRLVLWEANEGLVVLREKRIQSVIRDGSGGIRIVFPLLGDEVRARVPLTLRMITWSDQAVLTRESLRVRVKVAVWWRVADLAKYVFLIDPGLHEGNAHRTVGTLEAAESWLRTLTESTLRTLVSHASVAALVSSKATRYLHVEGSAGGEGDVPVLPGSPENLAADLGGELTKKTAEYGLEIQRVEIQEIGLSAEIQDAIDRVWKASLLPAQTEQEARARQIELQALASVLGADTVALNELLKNFQGASFMGWPGFLDSLFGRVAERTDRARIAPGAKRAELPTPDGDSGRH